MEVGLLAHFIIPMSHILEALAIGNVIYDDDAIGIAIVAVSDGSKPLLSCCIPLHKICDTRTNLAFSPLTLMVFVFWMRRYVQNRRRWC